MGPSINPTVMTLAPGQVETIRSGGAEIFMREIQGASEVKIGLDTNEFLPIAAGEGFTVEHEKFRLQNHNTVTVIVTVYQSTEPGVYIDRRDAATSVSIGGSFAVVNSAFTEEGGNVMKLPGSSVGVFVNQPVGTDTDNMIAVNTGGIYVKKLTMHIKIASTASNGTCGMYSTNIAMPLMVRQDVGIYEYNDGFYLPSGSQLNYTVMAGAQVNLDAYYDIL